MKNDEQWKSSVQYVDRLFGEGFVSRRLKQTTDGDCLFDSEAICVFYTEKLDGQSKITRQLIASGSYRIGRFITSPVRMIKLAIDYFEL